MDIRNLKLEYQGGLFISNLKKDSVFVMLSYTYRVKSKTKNGIRIINNKGEKIYIKFLKNVNIGNNKTEHFFREIESILTLDLINFNNPFHKVSDVYKITIQ